MSDRVNELIDTLKEKMTLLKDQCANERSKNDELTAENERLKANLAEKSNEISNLQSKVESLKEAQNLAKEQSVNPSEEENISDDQIDELVREIEYCIGQLKK
jgi:phage shock protein A